jgi:hypothetical protein
MKTRYNLLSKTRYKVFDLKTNILYEYSSWQWRLAFILIFLAGLGAGVLLFYLTNIYQ